MGIDYAKLTGSIQTCGMGGLSTHFVENAILAFNDPGAYLYAYAIPLQIASPTPDIMDVPSLLGRDILDQWKITIDKSQQILEAEVITSDGQWALGQGAPNAPITPAPHAH